MRQRSQLPARRLAGPCRTSERRRPARRRGAPRFPEQPGRARPLPAGSAPASCRPPRQLLTHL
eukprot:15053049-Alexandrium_andersonii.AAC.1